MSAGAAYGEGDIVLLSHSKLGVVTSPTTVREIGGESTEISRIVRTLSARDLAEALVVLMDRYNSLECKQKEAAALSTRSTDTPTTTKFDKTTSSGTATTGSVSVSEPRPKSATTIGAKRDDIDGRKMANRGHRDHTISPTLSPLRNHFYPNNSSINSNPKRVSDASSTNDDSAATTAPSTISSLSRSQEVKDRNRSTALPPPKSRGKFLSKLMPSKNRSTKKRKETPSNKITLTKTVSNKASPEPTATVTTTTTNTDTPIVSSVSPRAPQPLPPPTVPQFAGNNTQCVLPQCLCSDHQHQHQHQHHDATLSALFLRPPDGPFHDHHHHLHHGHHHSPYYIAYTPSRDNSTATPAIPSVPSPLDVVHQPQPHDHHGGVSVVHPHPQPLPLGHYHPLHRHHSEPLSHHHATSSMRRRGRDRSRVHDHDHRHHDLLEVLLTAPPSLMQQNRSRPYKARTTWNQSDCNTPLQSGPNPNDRPLDDLHRDTVAMPPPSGPLLTTSQTEWAQWPSPTLSGRSGSALPTHPVVNALSSLNKGPSGPHSNAMAPPPLIPPYHGPQGLMANASRSSTMDSADAVHQNMFHAENSRTNSRYKTMASHYHSFHNRDSAQCHGDSLHSVSDRRNSRDAPPLLCTPERPKRSRHSIHCPIEPQRNPNTNNNAFEGPIWRRERVQNNKSKYSTTVSVWTDREGGNEWSAQTLSMNRNTMKMMTPKLSRLSAYSQPHPLRHQQHQQHRHHFGRLMAPKTVGHGASPWRRHQRDDALHSQSRRHGMDRPLLPTPWTNGNITEDELFSTDQDGGSWHYDRDLYRDHMERSPSRSMRSGTRSDSACSVSEHRDEGRKSQSFSVLETPRRNDPDPSPGSISPVTVSSERRNPHHGNRGDIDSDRHFNRHHHHHKGSHSQSVVDLFDPKQPVLLGAANDDDEGAANGGKWRVELHRENGGDIHLEDGNEAGNECPEWIASSTPSQTPSYLKQEALWNRSMKLELSKNGTNSTGSSEDDDQWMLHNQINVNGHTENSTISSRRTTRAFFAENESVGFPNVETVKMRVSPHSNCTDFIASEHELHRTLYLQKRDPPKSPFMGSVNHSH